MIDAGYLCPALVVLVAGAMLGLAFWLFCRST
jgi:hypothetical protein